MILNIRGTNGSGKSSIVRTVKQRAGQLDILTIPRRRHPLVYLTREPVPPLAILGHYETETGGCDTIQRMDDVFGIIRSLHDNSKGKLNIIFEGIMVSGERLRTIKLHEDGYPLKVVGLLTSLNDCIRGVETRQEQSGRQWADLNTDRLIDRHYEVKRMMEHLKRAGVPTAWLSREEALKEALKLIGEE